MKRRDLFKNSLAASALAGLSAVTPRARRARVHNGSDEAI
jgi:hypothetical protein